MYIFSDAVTICLAIYVGCHLYLTLSAFFIETCKYVVSKIDNVTNDFGLIARSIDNLSRTFDYTTDTYRQNSTDERTSRNRVLVIMYAMVAVMIPTLFRIDFSSMLSSILPFLFQLFSAYIRGAQNGSNDQHGMNEEMRTMVMQAIMQNINRNNVQQVPINEFVNPTRFTERNNGAIYDSDTQSDITEINIGHVQPTEMSEASSQTHSVSNTNQSDTTQSDSNIETSVRSGDVSELSNVVVVNGTENI